MVYRVYVEKKEGLRHEAQSLKNSIVDFLRIEGLEELRIINRYDVENVERELFEYSVKTVFSEPPVDDVYFEPCWDGYTVFAVEYLPGQFDQRADSAAQCIQIISQGERPLVRTAKLYLLRGELSEADIEAVKHHVINPVEARLAELELPETLAVEYELPDSVELLDGFRQLDEAGLDAFLKERGLAMDRDDLRFCRNYFIEEGRDPTITEVKVLDTYWSDHCRHTTFNTVIDSVSFEDPLLESAYNDYLETRRQLGRTKPICLMDIGTIGAKYLKAAGKLDKLDESDEINACTVKIKVNVGGEEQDWLLLFKNETHNHPTEIEPFGGAATCIGGAIRDPLSGRAYVYSAMRVTGAADPTAPLSETIKGKLPQRKIVTTAAHGYSSSGNQIGLATGQVDELYHPGYAAKRMEIGAVIGAVPAENVRREVPAPGDIVILLGGRTGRDGMGGATGSSKSHTVSSLESCGAEVQKGNAPEERKLQRLFRNPEASKLIKRCNDFGAGGVSVAIGELAEGLDIQLDAVPKKYEGLDGTELAIAESQERMAVVVEAKDAERFCQLARAENLEATVVARVTESPRLVMRWKGRSIVDISRRFLDTNGADKHIDIRPEAPKSFRREPVTDWKAGFKALTSDLNVCSGRGLSECFDSTIGAGTVLMPYGGRRQRTPIQAMVNKISVEKEDTDSCSFMAWGYNPYIGEKSPYHSAYLAVVESVSKLIAAGAEFEDVYLSFQEYFEKPLKDGRRWGKPFAALLGALRAQKELGIAAIGGKDSMSGSFEDLDVPPTLVSFAVTTGRTGTVISPEFKRAGSPAVWLRPEIGEDGLPVAESVKGMFAEISRLNRDGKLLAAWTPEFGGAAEGIVKMCMGNGLGFEIADGTDIGELFDYSYGSFILELTEGCGVGQLLGHVTAEPYIGFGGDKIALNELERLYEDRLEPVYPCNIETPDKSVPAFGFKAENWPKPRVRAVAPLALIPVFPGTNCEYDTAKALERAGARTETIVINNLSPASIARSVDYFSERTAQANIIFIPGGFSGGDEPEGSGKFITAFFRSGKVKDAVNELLGNRDGLMCGICNGFQALIKLGLVPHGEIMDMDADCPTLSFNTIGRHQSKIVRTRIASNKSPWLMRTKVGEVYSVPISHGEGRFLADEKLIYELAEKGQVITQYVNAEGEPTYDIDFNPNGSLLAVEGICSPDGRVLGKMGHTERYSSGLYKNVPGDYDMGLFESAVEYFK
ncbi:MAG: phosphoribosylformylglycinamidine synthase [Oscillospiraceae bacterium]|nr:phosphoribosylformylglycinamidine synthase [Oscillospiraceae bacterium]